ncbi:MAG: hypothetical protein ABIK85_00710, partial [Candidatus Eisenbacteria bacterium]
EDSTKLLVRRAVARFCGAVGERIDGGSTGRLLLYLATGFVISRAVYIAAGVRFDAAPLGFFWQYLDPELVRNDLLRSCFHLHGQPPIFNMFLGVTLKLAGESSTSVFQGIYLACSFVLSAAVLLLQIRLGVSRTVALVLATLFMISPSCVLYEHWLFYSLPAAVLLTLSALFLHEFLRKRRTWAVVCVFVMLLLLAGIRCGFHLVHIPLVASALVVLCRGNRRSIVLAALVPLLALGLLSCRSLALFGKFGGDSWLGMNVWSTTGRNLPVSVREQLVEDGKLSQLSLIQPFSPLARYPAEYREAEGFEDVAALRQTEKSTGPPNLNHLAYIAISDGYLRDALFVAGHHPRAVCVGISRAWFQYFVSSAEDAALLVNRAKLEPMVNLYDYLFYGKIPYNLSRIGRLPIYARGRRHYVYAFLLLGLPILGFHAVHLSLKSRGPRGGLTFSQRMLILYLCFNILYVALTTNTLLLGENNRIRFMTDPFYIVLAGLFVQYFLIPRLAHRREGPQHRVPEDDVLQKPLPTSGNSAPSP